EQLVAPHHLAGGGGDLLVQGVPVTATRSYAIAEVDGDTAVVTQTVERSIGGQSAPATELNYAVDRKTIIESLLSGGGSPGST
ncbi:MAG TPA: hypothetical protein PK177_09285, partial [Burkholderiaceae bacterium]|nr:hypothetical protein [Burkholderiaceae bacterium]